MPELWPAEENIDCDLVLLFGNSSLQILIATRPNVDRTDSQHLFVLLNICNSD